MDILSRLPMKTLFNCRCVCKTWLHLISDPLFANLQIERSPAAILIKTIRRYGESRQLQLAQMTGQNTKDRVGVGKLKFTSEDDLPIYEISLTNSCNGLLCLTARILGDDSVYVCNPLMGEFITIPLPNDDDDKWRCKRSFGLGFCKSSNEYKVIQTFSIMRHTYEVVKNYEEAEIYTIGPGEWRSVGLAPCKISSTLPIDTLLNESIHWIASSVRGRLGPIYSFNFRSEQFRLILLPSVLDPNEKKKFKGYIVVGGN